MKRTEFGQLKIVVIIPAFNEEAALPFVLNAISEDLVEEIIVCNNGSTDRTEAVAREAGATVVDAPAPGYGNACLAGMEYLKNKELNEQPDVVVFIDGDYSDYPEEMPLLIEPIFNDQMDLVIGSRLLGEMPKEAMTTVQRFGNWLAPFLIRIFYKQRFTDLGPFRAITWQALLGLNMQDKNYGWTVEMQVKAAKQQLKCTEVPVRYRTRIAGQSKVSGTIKGAFLAGVKIIGTIIKEL
jgi:glycosyltransferase involved in cell wall biosynthesis